MFMSMCVNVVVCLDILTNVVRNILSMIGWTEFTILG